jgi:hypothetical protein
MDRQRDRQSEGGAKEILRRRGGREIQYIERREKTGETQIGDT